MHKSRLLLILDELGGSEQIVSVTTAAANGSEFSAEVSTSSGIMMWRKKSDGTEVTMNSLSVTVTDSPETWELIGDYSTVTTFTGVGQNITAVDVSPLSNLADLIITFNDLTTLDVSSNPNLTRLLIRANDIADLDISNNSLLTDVDANGNNLTQIVVDHILIKLVEFGLLNGKVNVAGNTAPSAAGVASADTLISRGWTVTRDA